MVELNQAKHYYECFSEEIMHRVYQRSLNKELTEQDRNTAFYILSVNNKLLELALLQTSVTNQYASLFYEMMSDPRKLNQKVGE